MTHDPLSVLIKKFVTLAAVSGPPPDQSQLQDATHRLAAELQLLPAGTDRMTALFRAATARDRPKVHATSFDAHIDRVLSNIRTESQSND